MKKDFFDSLSSDFVTKFVDKVNSSNSIAIASHMSPDDDSISSLLGVYYYLVNYLKIDEKKIKIIYTGRKTDKWKYFANYEKINFVDDIADELKDVDTLIFTDGSGWGRFSRKEEIKKFEGFTICIDHHATPEDYFDLHLVDIGFSSTAELVYRLFFEKEKLDKQICEIILMGILGDTGNFRYVKPSQSKTFEVAERLVQTGEIDIQKFLSKYDKVNEKEYKALAAFIGNSQITQVNNWPKFIISYIEKDWMKDMGVDENSTKEAKNKFSTYLTTIEGIDWGFVITPKDEGICTVSLRSLPGSVNVRLMMEKGGWGSGHDRAAGGGIPTKDPKDALKIIIDWMEKNKPPLG